MKKQIINLNLIIFALFLTVCFGISLFALSENNVATVSANNGSYARIKNDSTYLYRTAQVNENVENKWCILTKTFFVKILTNYNDVFYKVEYLNLTGYVKKQNLTVVNEIPKTPYPTPTNMQIKQTLGTYLRSHPKINNSLNNVIISIPSGTRNLPFYGKIFGDEAIDTQGTIWYLTEYQGQLGYIHSYFFNSFVAEQINAELTTIKNDITPSTLTPLAYGQNAILILISLIPLVAIFYLMYKPVKQTVPIKKQNKTKPKTENITRNINEPDL